jgi:hypothetical protein
MTPDLPAEPPDELTVEERRALMEVPTHTVDGVRLAEWEREFLARQLMKGSDRA